MAEQKKKKDKKKQMDEFEHLLMIAIQKTVKETIDKALDDIFGPLNKG